MEYQQQLQQQIDEKKRIKNQEHRSAEKQKEAEFSDYMSNQYKGPSPQHYQKKSNKKYDYDDDYDLDSHDGYRGDNRNNNKKYDNNYDDNYKKKGGAVRFSESTNLKHNSRRNRSPSPDSRDGNYSDFSDDNNYNNRNNNDYYKDDNKSNNNKNKNNNSQYNEYPGKDWVSKGEYDELSKLCDKLMNEQETLQSELRRQNHEIKV
jgi:hypothetical protein